MVKNIKYFIVDVDGTLTDGGIYYDEHGNELKKFCTKDAAGFLAFHRLGINVIILTGRKCMATEKRMKDLGVKTLYQGVKNKYEFLKDFIYKHNIKKDEIGYIGDDLNDYKPMNLVGYKTCPKNSCDEILNIADYISSKDGGCGAFRDVAEHILKIRNEWSNTINDVYESGT